MKIKDLFENWGITGIKITAGFAEIEWQPQPDEQQAAWELYVELITRVTVQPLADTDGDESTALSSVYKLFDITRQLLKEKGRKSQTFSKVALVVLNQKVRPFTARWHKKSQAGAFKNPNDCMQFRQELKEIQKILTGYANLLAKVGDVEDMQLDVGGDLGDSL